MIRFFKYLLPTLLLAGCVTVVDEPIGYDHAELEGAPRWQQLAQEERATIGWVESDGYPAQPLINSMNEKLRFRHRVFYSPSNQKFVYKRNDEYTLFDPIDIDVDNIYLYRGTAKHGVDARRARMTVMAVNQEPRFTLIHRSGSEKAVSSLQVRPDDANSSVKLAQAFRGLHQLAVAAKSKDAAQESAPAQPE